MAHEITVYNMNDSDFIAANKTIYFCGNFEKKYQYTGGFGNKPQVYKGTVTFNIKIPKNFFGDTPKVICSVFFTHITDSGGGGRWKIVVSNKRIIWDQRRNTWKIEIDYIVTVHGLTGVVEAIGFNGVAVGTQS